MKVTFMLTTLLIISSVGCDRARDEVADPQSEIVSTVAEPQPIIIDAVAEPELAKNTLVGTWSVTENFDEDKNVIHHYKTTRRADGSVTVQEIHINHKIKEYCVDEMSGTWKIEGSYYTETSPDLIIVAKIISINEDSFTYFVLHDPEDKIELYEIPEEEINHEFRTSANYALPKPPEGYSKSEEWWRWN